MLVHCLALVAGCAGVPRATHGPTHPSATDGESSDDDPVVADDGALDRLLARCDGSSCTPEVRVALAERLLDRAASELPTSSDAGSQDAARAIALLQAVADDRAVPPTAAVERALSLLLSTSSEAGDALDALAIAERIVRDAPTRPIAAEAWLFIGDGAFERGDLIAAASAYRAVLALSGALPQTLHYAHYKLAWVHLNLSDFDAAFDAFGEVARQAGGRLAIEARRDALSALMPRGRPAAEEVVAIRQLGGDQDVTLDLFARYEALLDENGATDRAQAFHAAASGP